MRSTRQRLTMGLLVVPTAALIGSGAAVAAKAAPHSLVASLRADQVVPQKPRGTVAHAAGSFTATLSGNGAGSKLSWRIAYSKLDNPRIVIADIHYGKQGKFGPVIVRLCGPCKSGQHGVTKVKETWVPAIQTGNAFITLITNKNPNGEIRGQIKSS